MNKYEILEKLNNGESIKVQTFMIFKRNKIVRGSIVKYSIGENTIKSNQFEAIFDLLAQQKKSDEFNVVYYKLK